MSGTSPLPTSAIGRELLPSPGSRDPWPAISGPECSSPIPALSRPPPSFTLSPITLWLLRRAGRTSSSSPSPSCFPSRARCRRHELSFGDSAVCCMSSLDAEAEANRAKPCANSSICSGSLRCLDARLRAGLCRDARKRTIASGRNYLSIPRGSGSMGDTQESSAVSDRKDPPPTLWGTFTGAAIAVLSFMVVQPRLGTMTWPDWEKESYPAAKDLVMIPMFAVLFPTVRYVFDNLILERVGRKVIVGDSKQQPLAADAASKDMDEFQQRRLTKFKESAWKGLYYLTAELFALAVTYNEPWFTESKQFWVGPGDQRWPNQMTRLKLKVLYGFAGGFYTYSIFALMFWETRRKDFGVSMSHHVAAVVLIVFSYLTRFARVGSVVLAIHDASDVILELAKLSKYLGSEVCASVAFVLFVVSWVLLRLIYFPAFVIWSTSYEVLQLLERETNPQGPVLYYIFNTLLISLFILHIYWWLLMWRMIVKQVRDWGKISDDIRSDSEDEGDVTKDD